jgi:uncharacterized membrane protein
VTFENPQLLALLLLLPVFALIWFLRGMRTVPLSLVLRLLAVALVVLALANPTQGRRIESSGPVVVLVDQSDSLLPQQRAMLRAEAAELAQTSDKADEDTTQHVVVLGFGAHTVSLADGEGREIADSLPAAMVETLDPSASNLETALHTARNLLAPAADDAGTAQTGHIVLLSDGVQTVGDALAEARLAAEEGLQVDVIPIEVAQQTPDLHITRLDSPRSLHVGEEYKVHIVVDNITQNEQATQATLRLWDGDQLLNEEAVELAPGENLFTFDNRAARAGVVRLQAEIEGPADSIARNSQAAATALVAPPPRVLLVEGREGGAQELSAALWNAEVDNEVIAADMMPTRLSRLEPFDGMVLVDVPAHTLSFDQMTTVQEFVRSEGRGLVAIGGTSSYGLGGYDNTPLEEVLPVTMEAPDRPDRAEVALLLILDRSASMDTALGVSKFDMAKEAAILSTETLQEEDTIGVLAFDTTQEWVVPFQRVGSGIGLQAIHDSIATLPTGGGTDIYQALAVGVTELSRQTAPVRHVVLLTDGRSFTDNRLDYKQLAESAFSQEMTISTIAIGFDSDTELLDNIAQWGGGRYYFADEPEDIPRLTLQESEIARSDPSVEGTFQADLAERHPLMRDFAAAQLPTLNGYVGTTAKETAQVVLASPDDDPVLASWQYGLGRAVSWTPSAADPWASTWLDWDQYGRFWAQIVRYTLPEADSGPLQVRLTPQPGGARLEADVIQTNGEPLDLANAVAQVTLPDGAEHVINLRQVAPGRYAQDLLLPADGPYGVLVVMERYDEQYRTETGYVQAVPAEYTPFQGSRDQVQGRALLQEIASMTGGEMLSGDATLDVSSSENTSDEAPANPWRDVWKWLLGAALVLWVLEIAVRRGIFVRERSQTWFPQ